LKLAPKEYFCKHAGKLAKEDEFSYLQVIPTRVELISKLSFIQLSLGQQGESVLDLMLVQIHFLAERLASVASNKRFHFEMHSEVNDEVLNFSKQLPSLRNFALQDPPLVRPCIFGLDDHFVVIGAVRLQFSGESRVLSGKRDALYSSVQRRLFLYHCQLVLVLSLFLDLCGNRKRDFEVFKLLRFLLFFLLDIDFSQVLSPSSFWTLYQNSDSAWLHLFWLRYIP